MQTLAHIVGHCHVEDNKLKVKLKAFLGISCFSCPLFELLAFLSQACLTCYKDASPPPTLYLASLSSRLKRLSTAWPPWEQEQSSPWLEVQMHCAGLFCSAESTKCILYLKNREPYLCCLILVADDVPKHRKTSVSTLTWTGFRTDSLCQDMIK